MFKTGWVVYTEMFTENGMERWFYGRYNDSVTANEVALELHDPEARTWGNVVRAEDADHWNIKNLFNNGIY